MTHPLNLRALMMTIYLDYAATTPVLPEVIAAMQPYLGKLDTSMVGNPSSLHEAGVAARLAVSRARATVAECLNAPNPESIVFSASASESNNWVIKGVAARWQQENPGKTGHIIISSVEHNAVLAPAEFLRDCYGWELTILPVIHTGQVSPATLEAALQPNTALVSIIYANNEIGALNPIAGLAQLCRNAGVPLHTDAVQILGKLPVDVQALGADYVTWSAHKFYGPKGVGGAYVRPGAPVPVPMVHGGGHENGHRSGTENVAGLVGQAEALAYQTQRLAEYRQHLGKLEGQLVTELKAVMANLPCELIFNTPQMAPHTPGVTQLSVVPAEGPPLEGETLVLQMDLQGFAVSSGSACHSAVLEPSRIVMAQLGKTKADELTPAEFARAISTVRFSLGWHTTPEDISNAAQAFGRVVAKLLPQPAAV